MKRSRIISTIGEKYLTSNIENEEFSYKKALSKIGKNVEKRWLELYRNRKEEIGLSVNKKVSASDEWLAEAYMETDYSKLSQKDFEKTVAEYLGYLVCSGDGENES